MKWKVVYLLGRLSRWIVLRRTLKYLLMFLLLDYPSIFY